MSEREEAREGLRAAVGIINARMQANTGAMQVEQFVQLLAAEVEERGGFDVANSLASLAEVLLGVTSEAVGQTREVILQEAARHIGSVD